MLQVMFELRTKKFASGDAVKARLKAGVVVTSDTPSLPLSHSNPNLSQMVDYQHMRAQSSPGNRYLNNNGGRKNKKKKNASGSKGKSNSNKGKNNNSNRRNSNGRNKKGGGQERPQQSPKQKGSSTVSSNNTANGTRSKGDTTTTASDRHIENSPPSLGDEQFPALSTDDLVDPSANKIEVETVPQDRPEDDYEKKSANSDGASTATTSTSSSTSKQQHTMGGYAAALLKVAPKPVPLSKDGTESKQDVSKRSVSSKKKIVASRDISVVVKPDNQESTENPTSVDATSVVVTPPSWGGGRSFADVLRKEAAAAAAAAAVPEQ